MAALVAHAPTARSGENPSSAAARFAGQGAADASRPVYRRHEAEKTVLYQIVSRELATFLAEVRDHYDRPLPTYVEKELRDFMDCGILARGFVTAVCESCGQKLLVALSCKRRGICPSCGCRRMCNAAAHLVDHVVPDIPVRQWVMSAPMPSPC